MALHPFDMGRVMHAHSEHTTADRSLAEVIAMQQLKGLMAATQAAIDAPGDPADPLPRVTGIWWHGWMLKGLLFEATDALGSPLIDALKRDASTGGAIRRVLYQAFSAMSSAYALGLPRATDGAALVRLGRLMHLINLLTHPQ